MPRCTWTDGAIAEPLACALPATVNGYCIEHAHDVERELAAEREHEAGRDVVRAMVALRTLGVDLGPWRAAVLRIRGLVTRTIALAVIDGAPLEPDLERERRRILRAPALEPVSDADARHLDALRDLERAPAHRSSAA